MFDIRSGREKGIQTSKQKRGGILDDKRDLFCTVDLQLALHSNFPSINLRHFRG